MPYGDWYIQQAKKGAKSEAKGLEGIIFRSSKSVQAVSYKVNTVFYGKGEMSTTGQNNKRLRNPLDMGILPLLDILLSVDACELVNYALDKTRSANIGGTKKFDPKTRPTQPFEIIKWTFQKAAYDAQTLIDGFYNEVGNLNNPDLSQGEKLIATISKVKSTFVLFTDTVTQARGAAQTNPDVVAMLEAFPQLRNVGNYINDSLSFFDRFSDFRQLQNADVQKAVNTLNKVRQYCVLIQSLSNPIGSAITLLAQGAITSELTRILKDIDVQKLIPTLKNISQELKKIASMLNSVKNVIDTSRLLIRLFMNLMFAFKVIIGFFKSLPAPNQFTTVGITTTYADSLRAIQEQGPNNFEARLAQINTLLNTVSLFLNSVLPIVNEIIQKINTLIANVERCKDSESILPKDVLEDVKNNATALQNTVNGLQKFLDDKKQNDLTRSSNSQFGQFTINIITEEVTEEAFGLRRRYGVALNNQGILQVQSQPTFASDNNVIINEVKLLLQQKGLIKEDTSIYTQSELEALNESRSFLADDNLDIYPESDTILDSEISSEIRDFVTSTKKGKRFFRRSMGAVQRRRQQLNRDLGRSSTTSTNQIPNENTYEIKVYKSFLPGGPQTFLIKTSKIKAETEKDAIELVKEEVDPNNNKNYRYLSKII